MSVTLETLRQRTSDRADEYETFTTSSAGNVAGTTLVSTDLQALTLSDDTYIGQWVLVTSGTCDGQERLISAFTQSGGTVTVDTAFTAQIATSVTGEIHRIQPSKKTRYINQAMQNAYPFFVERWDDKTLVGGNFLPNSDFEDWAQATYPDYWTNVGAGCTVTEETGVANVWHGDSSIKIVRTISNGAAISIDHEDWPSLLDLEGLTVSFYCYAKTSTPSAVRLQIHSADAAGNTTTDESDYHTGGGGFEKLELEDITIRDDAVTVSVRLNIETATTVYFDKAVLFGREPYEYLLPTGLEFVTAAYSGTDWYDRGYYADEKLLGWSTYNKAGISYIKFDARPLSERKIRLVGYGYFTDLDADIDDWDINDKQANIVCDGAAALLLRAKIGTIKSSDSKRFRELAEDYEGKFERGIRLNQMVVGTLQTNIATDSGDLP